MLWLLSKQSNMKVMNTEAEVNFDNILISINLHWNDPFPSYTHKSVSKPPPQKLWKIVEQFIQQMIPRGHFSLKPGILKKRDSSSDYNSVYENNFYESSWGFLFCYMTLN